MNSIHYANRYTSEQLAAIADFLSERCSIIKASPTADYLDCLLEDVKQALGITRQRELCQK